MTRLERRQAVTDEIKPLFAAAFQKNPQKCDWGCEGNWLDVECEIHSDGALRKLWKELWRSEWTWIEGKWERVERI